MARIQSAQDHLDAFLESETFALTVNGAIGRNRTYRDNVGSNRREEFREALRTCLNSQLDEYRSGRVGEDRHVANIEALSLRLSEHHQEILVDGRFRIGAAQKALNLYLKYAWARRVIPEPPHCPIDSVVLKEIQKNPRSARCQICQNVTWTKICTTQEYLHFVHKAKNTAHALGQSLACWELEVWEKATRQGRARPPQDSS